MAWQRPTPPKLPARSDHAYDLAYNLDHEQAVEALLRAIDKHPTDPSAHRGVAALTWLRMLFLRGQVLVDSQMTATFRFSGKTQDPPAEMDEVFHTHIARAIELSEDAVRQTSDDPKAHYQLGASLGAGGLLQCHDRGRWTPARFVR